VQLLMRRHTQRILGDPRRGDGRASDGTPGDCLRTATASMLDLPVDAVPHFALYREWWTAMRRWARSRGDDFTCLVPVDGAVHQFLDGPGLLLASGPSPRGPFWHTVVVDEQLDLVHDPHPSRVGLTAVEDVLVYVDRPLFPAPYTLALTAGP
jgi:hypothetical protein